MIQRTLIYSLTFLWTISCILAARLGADQIEILKRKVLMTSYNERFHVSNITFACNQTYDASTKGMIKQLLQRDEDVLIRRVTRLAEEDMEHLLQYKGGTVMPEYLAKNRQTAFINFPDAKRFRFRRNFRQDVVAASQMLRKLNNGKQFQNRKGAAKGHGMKIIYDPPVGDDKSHGKIRNQLSAGSSKSVTGSLIMGGGAWPGKNPGGLATSHRKGLKVSQQKGTQTGINGNLKSIGKRRRRQTNDPLFPSDDDDTVIDSSNRSNVNCSEAGQPSAYDQNYLHLCKVCTGIRILPQNRYPNVINEVFCESADDGCLGSGNGKCVPTIFNVHLLRRKDDMCVFCIKDSEALAVNDWETYIEPISVGCECMLNKNSNYKNEWFGSSAKAYSKTGLVG